MVKRFLSGIVLFNCIISFLIAGEVAYYNYMIPTLADSVRSSVIFKVGLQDFKYYSLNRIDTKQTVPLDDLSRQFLAPGPYQLKYEHFGYKIHNRDFVLGHDQELEITHQPDPVSPNLTRATMEKQQSVRRNLLYALGLLAVSGTAKYLGDKAYEEYQNETDPDRIVELRQTCQLYEASCLTSAGFSGLYLGLSIKSFFGLVGAKKDIRNAMKN